uniref:uncharacterized protein LOC101313941 n=1 Tax=Fragaria vesca subsp. vesca TaxID=101020 RepID=UPI0005C8B5DE|nr:PREDICTED: uncharacterized protein LOC101313941 [Fragaria vesca subsp. vesca]
MDEQLKHFSHEHPLMYKEESPPKNEASGEPVSCSACGEPVLGPNYSCNQCSDEFIILHKPCAQLGREIQHPMHNHPLTILTRDARQYEEFLCDICHALSYGKSYSCSKCGFNLDLKCAAGLTNIVCIEHFSHQHLLRFIENPSQAKRGSPALCIGCLEPVLGPSYYCDRAMTYSTCSVFLHKSCAELPLEIQHPMHRQHSLILNLNRARDHQCDACDKDCGRRFNYSCFQCGFNLDLRCASEEGYKHFSHQHPLMFKKGGGNDKRKGYTVPLVVCDGCHDPILGPRYTCINRYRRRRCSFNLHKSCADLPGEIQHPLHRQHSLFLLNTIQDIRIRCLCNACNKVCRYRYNCSVCDFNLHLKCASKWQNILDDSHQHQYIVPPMEMIDLQINCHICGDYWTGSRVFYTCSICQLLVHEECASLPSDTKIPGHQHRLKLTWFLQEIYPKEEFCKICSTNIGKSPTVYYCQECCEYVAHPTCITVEYFQKEENQGRSLGPIKKKDRSLDINHITEGDDYESDDAEEIRHFSHQHLLVSKDYHHEVKDDRLLTCQGCVRPITEDFYSCTKQEEESCQFYLHKICARLPEKMLLPLLHQHQFTLHSQAPSIDGVFQCSMCGIFHHGFVYSCDKCALQTGGNLLLDSECIMYWENRDLKHESHAHRLLLDMNWEEDICCRGCGSKIFFCFSCKRCNFHLCIACVRLPLTGTHRYDKHVLKLTYASRIEDEVVGYYCEICEGKRDPAHWFYWCKDCNFDCHPHCIIGRYPRVKLGSTYKHNDHVQHQVTLVSKWKSPIRGDKRDNILPCERCHELCQGLVFECRECNINFHRDGCCGATDSASSSRSPQIEELS